MPKPTINSEDVYTEQLTDAEQLLYLNGESQTRIRPGWVFDTIRWRDEWIASDPADLDDLETYESDGYLVTLSITPHMDDETILTESDLAFEAVGLNNSEVTLLREKLPDAGMFVHPTEAIPLFEPSEEFDYHIPSGVVVEVAANDVALTFGVKADGGGMVGQSVYLPEMDEMVGESDSPSETTGEDT